MIWTVRSLSTTQSGRAALTVRATLLLTALLLALVHAHRGLALGGTAALAAAAAAATRLDRSTRWATPTRCLEALVAAVAVAAAGSEGDPFLPYIAAPVFAGGLAGGLVGAAYPAGVAALTLLTDASLLGPGLHTWVFVRQAAEWVALALLLGFLGAWVHSLQLRHRESRDAGYAEAHQLLSQLYTVTRHLPGSLDPVTIAAGLLEDLRGVVAYERGVILARTGGERLVPLAQVGTDRVDWDYSLSGENAFADAWVAQTPQVRGRTFGPAGQVGARAARGSSLVLPLHLGVRSFGLLGLDSSSRAAFDQAVVREVAGVVDRAAVRLETGLLFDEIREVATTQERQRLAREIHDGIAQELASIGYQVDALSANAADEGAAATARDLQQLRGQITELVGELRHSIFELRSGVDRHGGLGVALSAYVRGIGTSSELKVHLSLDESTTRLPAETEAELLRIAQEAITNARKHAGAHNLWVTCEVDPPSARLVVLDDGIGLGVKRPDSYGLEIMRERAARLRASFAVSAHRPHGTRVEVTLRGNRQPSPLLRTPAPVSGSADYVAPAYGPTDGAG